MPVTEQDERHKVVVGMGELVRKTYKTADGPDAFGFELKEVDLEGSTFEGDAAAMGNRDDGDDIISPGAFKKSIRERVSAGRVKLLDHHNQFTVQDLWGVVLSARELAIPTENRKENGPTHKLRVTHRVSRKQAAQDALRDMKDGILDAMSIGFRPVRVEFIKDNDEDGNDPELAWLRGVGVRIIHELAWWEDSLVIWGMNTEAIVVPTSVKDLLGEVARMEKSGTVDETQVRYAIRALQGLVDPEVNEGLPVFSGAVLDATERLAALVEKVDEDVIPDDAKERLALLHEEFAGQAEDGEPSFAVFLDGRWDYIQKGTLDREDKIPAEEDSLAKLKASVDELREALEQVTETGATGDDDLATGPAGAAGGETTDPGGAAPAGDLEVTADEHSTGETEETSTAPDEASLREELALLDIVESQSEE